MSALSLWDQGVPAFYHFVARLKDDAINNSRWNGDSTTGMWFSDCSRQLLERGRAEGGFFTRLFIPAGHPKSPLCHFPAEDFVDLVRQEWRCCRKLASYRERDWSCFTWEPCVKPKHNQKDCTLPLILLGNSSSILPVPLLTFLAFTDTGHTFCSAEMHSLLYILVMTWGWTENLLLLCTDAYSERVTFSKTYLNVDV